MDESDPMDPTDEDAPSRDSFDDEELFRAEMGDVAPLKQTVAALQTSGAFEPTPAQLERRYQAESDRRAEGEEQQLTLADVAQVEPRAELAWRQDGVQLGVFNKLRTAGYIIEGHLDLHHMTVKEARLALWKFVDAALEADWRCVLIAHGRGERSVTPARLKSYVAHWLLEMPSVIAYHSALPHHGGTGATYVLVRKSKRARDETREQHGGKADGGDVQSDK